MGPGTRLDVLEKGIVPLSCCCEILGPKTDEITGEWRRLHGEELYAVYSSPNITWVVKIRRLRQAGHVARMGERRCTYRVWWGDMREGDHLEDPGTSGRITLTWIFQKWDWAVVNAVMNLQVL